MDCNVWLLEGGCTDLYLAAIQIGCLDRPLNGTRMRKLVTVLSLLSYSRMCVVFFELDGTRCSGYGRRSRFLSFMDASQKSHGILLAWTLAVAAQFELSHTA